MFLNYVSEDVMSIKGFLNKMSEGNNTIILCGSLEGNKLITILSDGSKKEVELEGLSQGSGIITDQTTTETGNTITTIINGNIKSVTEKDNTGKVVSDKVLVNDKDLSEIIQGGSEWASKEDVNSVLSDTYSELGW